MADDELMARAEIMRYFQAALPSYPRAVPHSSRGFTLVELLAVVTITGILSVLAVVGFRRHMLASRGGEALSVMQAIRSAQESFMAENHVYLNVSTDSEGKNWYPQTTPNTNRYPFLKSAHGDYARWQQLAPSVKQTVMFGYLVNAGVPGTKLPPLQVASAPAFASPQPLDWYVIQASGDVDGNGVFARYASTSMTGEMYIEKEGE